MRENFEGTHNRVIDGCSRGGGRRLYKENVGWIVDLNSISVEGDRRRQFALCQVANVKLDIELAT